MGDDIFKQRQKKLKVKAKNNSVPAHILIMCSSYGLRGSIFKLIRLSYRLVSESVDVEEYSQAVAVCNNCCTVRGYFGVSRHN